MIESVLKDLMAAEFVGLFAISVFVMALGGSMILRGGKVGLYIVYIGAYFGLILALIFLILWAYP